MTQTHPYIYKITTADLWARAEQNGIVPKSPIDEADGYMHFSTAAQLRETLRLHFKAQSDLRVLRIQVEGIESDLKWEPSRGGDLFPHLYAELPVTSVSGAHIVSVAPDGVSDLPEDFA